MSAPSPPPPAPGRARATELALAFLLGAAVAAGAGAWWSGRSARPLEWAPRYHIGVNAPASDLPAVPAPSSELSPPGPALRIDPNSASAGLLQSLPGIGPKLAQRIIDTRAAQPFATVDDLRRVPGIGPKTLDKIRPFLHIPPLTTPG
jgi:competence ComEA-like helix-hairpin-helix protein